MVYVSLSSLLVRLSGRCWRCARRRPGAASARLRGDPSEASFFMVGIRCKVEPVIEEEFRKKKVAGGQPFPLMLEHLRVSVDDAAERRQTIPAEPAWRRARANGAR